MPSTSHQTMVVIAVFALGYLFHIIRQAARHQIDLYDLTMLSMVAIIPCVFAYFPGLAYWLASIAGVAFPFVVMFAILLAILFVVVHRLTVMVHELERDNILLIQEVSLLRQLAEQSRSVGKEA